MQYSTATYKKNGNNEREYVNFISHLEDSWKKNSSRKTKPSASVQNPTNEGLWCVFRAR